MGGLSDLLYGLSTKNNGAGHRYKRKTNRIKIEDLTRLSIDLPGHGEIGRDETGIKCGKHSLKHGEYVRTMDGTYIEKRPEQFRHCCRMQCPVCGRKYCNDHAHDLAHTIWNTRDKLGRQGWTPAVYHVVVSPPQPDNPEALLRVMTLEGWKDLRSEAVELLGELGALGGAILYHPFRENGKYGLQNGYKTGNDGDPDHWRLAPHYHGIVIFNGIPPVWEIAEISARTGWVINLKTPEDEDIRRSDREFSEARIKTLDDCEYLARYLYSHAGVMFAEGHNRRCYIATYLNESNPRALRTLRLRPGADLLRQGYIATYQDPAHPEEPQVLYWDQLYTTISAGNLYLSEEEILRLSEVECINSAPVQCAAADFDYCQSIIEAEYERQRGLGLLHLVGVKRDGTRTYDMDVRELWAIIRADTRFLTQFVPYDAPEGLRNPRLMQVDGEKLPQFVEDMELYDDVSPEYARYCAEADRREAEYEAERSERLRRSSSGGGL